MLGKAIPFSELELGTRVTWTGWAYWVDPDATGETATGVIVDMAHMAGSFEDLCISLDVGERVVLIFAQPGEITETV